MSPKIFNELFGFDKKKFENAEARRTEAKLEKWRKQEIKDYLFALEAVSEADHIPDDVKQKAYQEVADGVLTLLHPSIDMFNLSVDVFAIRPEACDKPIKNLNVVDLDYVESYVKSKNKKDA